MLGRLAVCWKRRLDKHPEPYGWLEIRQRNDEGTGTDAGVFPGGFNDAVVPPRARSGEENDCEWFSLSDNELFYIHWRQNKSVVFPLKAP